MALIQATHVGYFLISTSCASVSDKSRHGSGRAERAEVASKWQKIRQYKMGMT